MMKYKLKAKDGKVSFLLRSGNDLVKNRMSIASAEHVINTGEVVESDVKGYPICVDEKWYFEGEEIVVNKPTGKKKGAGK